MTASVSIRRTFRGKRVLLSGSSGFVGKAIIERLLSIDVAAVYILIRASKGQTSEMRKTAIFDEDPHFGAADAGAKKDMLKRIIAIEGDLMQPDLGIDPLSRRKLMAGIDVVIHSAGLTTFHAPLDEALEINIRGALKMQKIAEAVGAKFVHVSTAFVNSHRTGVIGASLESFAEAVQGSNFPSDQSLQDELRFLDSRVKEIRSEQESAGRSKRWLSNQLIEEARTIANERGWPNIYTYTKFLSEFALRAEREDSPLALVRPSVIWAARRYPYTGWIDGVRNIDHLIIAYGKGEFQCFPVNPDHCLDVIPIDDVVHGLLASAAALEVEPEIVVQIGSSAVNPLPFGQLARALYDYFKAMPIRRANSDLVSVKPFRFASLLLFKFVMEIRSLFWNGADALTQYIPAILGSKSMHKKVSRGKRHIERERKVFNLFWEFCSGMRTFDADSAIRLIERLSKDEKEDFGFDPREINWDHYLKHSHLPALVANETASAPIEQIDAEGYPNHASI